MKYEAVIFDLDGTLWDASVSALKAWQQTVRDHFPGMKEMSMEDVTACMGMSKAKITDYYRGLYGDAAEAVVTRCMDDEAEIIGNLGADIFDGLEDALKKLSEKYVLCIVSNCQYGYIESFYKVSGLESYFKDYLAQAHTGLSKAENIGIICRRNGIRSAVYVGDTCYDEEAARGAGCDFIHAAYGFGKVKAPDAVINSPAELVSLLCD